VAPTQEMIDEGIAREVISRVQKLRKKAKLQPSDPVTVRGWLGGWVFCRSSPSGFSLT
jgi:hypothetical protein